jgi:hypothetical protein
MIHINLMINKEYTDFNFIFSRDALMLFYSYYDYKHKKKIFCSSDGGPAVYADHNNIEIFISDIEEMIANIYQIWKFNFNMFGMQKYKTTVDADNEFDEITVLVTKEYLLSILIGMLKICIKCKFTPDSKLRISAD